MFDLFKQLLFMTKNSVLGSGLSYAFTIFLANYFGPERFGEYSYIYICGTIAGVLTNYETEKTAPKLSIESYSLNYVFSYLLSAKMTYYAIVFILCFPMLLVDSNLAVGILAIALAALNLSSIYEIMGKNIFYSYIYLIERLCYLGIGWVLYLTETLTLFTLFLTLFIVTLVSLIIQLMFISHVISKFKFVMSSAFEVAKSNFLLLGVTISTYAYGGFSRIILEAKMGLEILGVYSAGWQLILAATIFQAQVVRVWRVKITTSIMKDNRDDLRHHLRSYFLYSFIPMGGIAFGLYIFRSFIVTILFGEEYAELINVIPILCLYFLVVNLDALNMILWIAKGAVKIYFGLSLFFMLLLFAILYLIPANSNLVYYVIAVVAVHAVSMCLQLTYFKKLYYR